MGSTTTVKVAEIFTQAGTAFSRLGELTMQLQSAADDGTPKWTDEEIDMLNIAITRFCSDLTEISLRVKQRGISQLKQTLKKKIYEDAGVPVKQIALSAISQHSGLPPIVLGTADILQPLPQQQHFVALQQQQPHHHIIHQQQHQLQQQHQQIHQFIPQQQQQHMQQLQLIQPHQQTTVIQQHHHHSHQQQQLMQQHQQQIFVSHIPTGSVVLQPQQPAAAAGNNHRSTSVVDNNTYHQQQLANPIIVTGVAPSTLLENTATATHISRSGNILTSSADHRNAMMLTLNRLNTATTIDTSLDGTTVVHLDDDDNEDGNNGNASLPNASGDGNSSSMSDDADAVLPADVMTEQLKCAFEAVVGSDDDVAADSAVVG